MSHEKFEYCIDECHNCALACDHCATACLQESDGKVMARCIELNLSCAAVCALAEREMARGSEFAGRVCQLCAEIAERCAEECGKHKSEHCRRCADACRRCAEACREMVAQDAGGSDGGGMRHARA